MIWSRIIWNKLVGYRNWQIFSKIPMIFNVDLKIILTMPRRQKKEHCVYQYVNISVSKLLYYSAEKCGVLQILAFCSVFGCNVLLLQDTDKSKHSTRTGELKWIQSIMTFICYRSGNCTAKNNMPQLTDLVKNYIG